MRKLLARLERLEHHGQGGKLPAPADLRELIQRAEDRARRTGIGFEEAVQLLLPDVRDDVLERMIYDAEGKHSGDLRGSLGKPRVKDLP